MKAKNQQQPGSASETGARQIVEGARQDDQLRELHPAYREPRDGKAGGSGALHVFFPAVAATTAMTAFSYLVSENKQRNFREPQLLGRMAGDLIGNSRSDLAGVSGWVAHYAVGTLFSAGQLKLQESVNVRPTAGAGVIMGLLSGLAGVAMWKTTLAAHPSPSRVNKPRYYGHLLLAHIVFSVVVNLTSRNVERT